MLIVDSGLGGLSVVRALRAVAPLQPVFYVADTAGFPYGARPAEEITARAAALLSQLQSHIEFSTVVLACNTLSTLSLDTLRGQFDLKMVGTVPAIKVAAARSQTRRFTLLSTPNTAYSDYTKRLINQFAADCVVDCYGAPNLAAMTEQFLLGSALNDTALRAELAPAFHDDARGKTDAVILGCTHYPLLGDALQRHAPWHVEWIDSSQAIAQQALRVQDTSRAQTAGVAFVTSANDVERYAPIFAAEGFAQTQAVELPLLHAARTA